MRKTRRDFKKEAVREPFELDLENPPEGGPEFITFRDPNKLETDDAFLLDLMRPAEVFQLLLSDEDYKLWWEEWRAAPIEETNALLEDVQKHYGADPGKRGR
jgi:hypothetical protein